MRHTYDFDHNLTNYYIPNISTEPYTPLDVILSFKNLESRYLHEGRNVNPNLTFYEEVKRAFRAKGLNHYSPSTNQSVHVLYYN